MSTDEVSERFPADLLLQTVVNNTFYRSFGAATRILLLQYIILYTGLRSALHSPAVLSCVYRLSRSLCPRRR